MRKKAPTKHNNYIDKPIAWLEIALQTKLKKII